MAAFELPVYAARKGRTGCAPLRRYTCTPGPAPTALRRRPLPSPRRLAARSALCLAANGAAFAALLRLNRVAATWTLVVPFFFSSFALMLGNWSQHAFVNPDRPRSAAGMTYSCLNHPDNQRTFNDGYHIQHHADSRLHWTLLPQRFMETLPQLAAEDALVFHGIHFFDVGIAGAPTNQPRPRSRHRSACGWRLAALSERERDACVRAR